MVLLPGSSVKSVSGSDFAQESKRKTAKEITSWLRIIELYFERSKVKRKVPGLIGTFLFLKANLALALGPITGISLRMIFEAT